jgi:hypothetical protein
MFVTDDVQTRVQTNVSLDIIILVKQKKKFVTSQSCHFTQYYLHKGCIFFQDFFPTHENEVDATGAPISEVYCYYSITRNQEAHRWSALRLHMAHAKFCKRRSPDPKSKRGNTYRQHSLLVLPLLTKERKKVKNIQHRGIHIGLPWV